MSSKTGVYEYRDYREFLRVWMETAVTGKRGQLARLAEAGNIHKTTLSQVFSGRKDLSEEQAFAVSHHLGLGVEETEYFVLLVSFARAGTGGLKDHFRRQIETRLKNRKLLSSRVSKSRDLTEEERAIYYSNWMYSAVRNLCAIEGWTRPALIARRLGIEPRVLSPILDFLLRHRLCLPTSQGVSPGPAMTHLSSESPLVARHHANWRIKALERHPALEQASELAYTAPMTLSAEDALKVRDLLADLVEKTDRIVGPSASQKLYCMCLDWFEVK